MDILNLWNDDPEQILLELGFGCDEPDLSGRIPARFINYESQARGINLQVFLEAQKNRLDLENPDVSNRFRQLEVLQQVTTAFSSLMVLSSSPPMRTPLGKDLSPEAQEKRRYMGMLFRRASKKSLSQMHSHKTQEPTPELLHPPPGFGDQKIPLKRLRTGLLETVCLSPLAEEQLDGPVPQTQPQLVSFIAQEGALRPEALKECDPLTVNTFLEKKTGPGQATESFEMEEMSFDEGSFTGSYTRGTENLVRGVIKSNSCQSDSSGFLEEPFIPGPELIKALSGLSGGSTVSQSSKRPGSLSPSAVDTLMLSSPCPSQEPSLLFGPSTSPVPFSLLKSDLQGSEMETPPDAPCPHLSPLPQDSESTAFSAFSYVPSTSSFPSPAPNFASSAMSFPWSDSSSGSPRNTYSEYTEVALHKNVLSASGDLSLLLSSPFAFPPITESLSQSSNNNQKNSSLSDSDRTGLSDTSTNTQNKENKIPFFLTFLLDKDSPSVPSPLVLDSCKFEKGCPSLPSLSPNPSIPSCQSDMPLHHPHGLRDPTAQRKADLTEPSIFQLGQSCSHDGNTDLAPASPVQDIIHVKMDHFTVDLEDTLQRNKKEEEDGEGDTDTMQTQDTVYISDRESSAGLSEGSTLIAGNMCNQTEPDQAVSSDTLYDKLLSKTNQEELRKFSQMESNGKISESASNFILHNEVSEEQSRLEVELIKIDSLDLAFETSVDGSEDENGDVDNFFQQLDTEELVFWAEPIQVFNSIHSLEESGSFEAADRALGNSLLPRSPAAPDSFSSTGNVMPLSLSSSATVCTDQTSRNAATSSDTHTSLTLAPYSCILTPATPDINPSGHSVSVQMSSSPSSHIVHRKDIPYMTESKCTLLPSNLPLDTSTPFRAVQSWTDLHIQRNTLITKLSHGALHAVPQKWTVSTSASEMGQRPPQIFSPSSSLPLLSHNCLPGMARNYRAVSVSVDTGLQLDKVRELDRKGNEDEEKLQDDNETATMLCCCSSDHQCVCCTQKSYKKQHTLGNIPYLLDELEEMMLCLQKFCSVLSNVEKQLSEDQAAVYSTLSDQDREKIHDIEELRQAVKKEAGELEMQLNDRAHHYDDSLKMKMHRLLDEQSLLCSRLRVALPDAVPRSSIPTHQQDSSHSVLFAALDHCG